MKVGDDALLGAVLGQQSTHGVGTSAVMSPVGGLGWWGCYYGPINSSFGFIVKLK